MNHYVVLSLCHWLKMDFLDDIILRLEIGDESKKDFLSFKMEILA